MPKVKVTGKGEIEEVVKGKVYKIRHHLGRDPETGKYVRSPKRTVHGTKSDARRALEDYRIELEGGYGNPDKITVADYAQEWFHRRELSGRYSPETIKTDRRHVRRIVEMFGGQLLGEVDPIDVSRAYALRLDSGEITTSTLHNLNGVFSQMMKSAVRDKLIATNPCDGVDAPRPKPKERRSFELEDALRLAKAIKESERSGKTVAVWLALATGMRRGEILGLLWRNVDFERKRVYVGLQYASDKSLRDPKSEKSHRWIGIDDGTVLFLKEWKEQQAREMQVAGLEQQPGTPVCTNRLFSLMDPNTFSRWRRAYFVEHGLGEFTEGGEYVDSQGRKRRRRKGYVGYNLHELRHTQATMLIGQGSDIKTVQHRLGHSSASLTMNIYAHAIAQKDAEAAVAMGGMLGLVPPSEGFEEACRKAHWASGPIRSAQEAFGCWIFEPAAPGSDPLAVPMDGGEPAAVPIAGLIDGDGEAVAFADALGTTPQDLLKAIVGKGGRNLLVPGEYAG